MRCDRCGAETRFTHVSWYNDQEICNDCRHDEQQRDDYQDCREAERQAVEQGNMNFHFLPPWKVEPR